MSVRYVTIKMIAEHVGLGYEAVRLAIHRRNLKGVESFGGRTGMRIPERVVNAFIRKEWPWVGEMTIPQIGENGR
jgi:hypothetical protein